QNDKNGLKITVYVREKGQIVDLTGYAVKYEAINQIGQFVRDDAEIVDAKNGVFSYTLSSQAVSTSDDWTAYFVMEKSTERMSTPDIRITLRRDVKEGNIKIENYISEFEIIKKTLDELQQKLNTMNVVKKTGDTMTNSLAIDLATSGGLLLKRGGTNVSGLFARQGSTGKGDQTYLYDYVGNKIAMDYNSKDGFTFNDSTNLVKKAGDIINGLLEFKVDNAIVLGSRSFKSVIHKGSQGELIFAPSTKEQGDSWDWSKRVEFRTDGTIRQATDTDWIQMSINTANASNVEGRQVTRAKRNGDQVSVIGSLKNVKEGQVVFNVPVAMRPAQQITDVVIIAGPPYSICEFNIETGGNVRIYNITTDKIIHFSINYLV
ncbi:BppU family phage baseplate upper protein, partial [Bacillus sp. GMs2/2]